MPADSFGRLKSLSEERLTAVHNALATRTPEYQVARMIQQQWGLFDDVAEATFA